MTLGNLNLNVIFFHQIYESLPKLKVANDITLYKYKITPVPLRVRLISLTSNQYYGPISVWSALAAPYIVEKTIDRINLLCLFSFFYSLSRQLTFHSLDHTVILIPKKTSFGTAFGLQCNDKARQVFNAGESCESAAYTCLRDLVNPDIVVPSVECRRGEERPCE